MPCPTMGLWQRCIVVLFGQIKIWSFLPGWVTKNPPPLVNRSPWEMPEITVFEFKFFITFSCGCVCRSEDNLLESSLSFHHVDPETELWLSDWGQASSSTEPPCRPLFQTFGLGVSILTPVLTSIAALQCRVSAEHCSSSNSPEPVSVSDVTFGQRTRAGTGRRWGTKTPGRQDFPGLLDPR